MSPHRVCMAPDEGGHLCTVPKPVIACLVLSSCHVKSMEQCAATAGTTAQVLQPVATLHRAEKLEGRMEF